MGKRTGCAFSGGTTKAALTPVVEGFAAIFSTGLLAGATVLAVAGSGDETLSVNALAGTLMAGTLLGASVGVGSVWGT